MAFGVDATSHATPVVDGTGITWTHTCGANANKVLILICAGGSGGSNTITSVNYAGRPCTSHVEASDANFERAAIYQLHSPPTGSAVVSVAVTGPTVDLAAGAISFNEAEPWLQFGSVSTANSTNPQVTVAKTSNGDIVVSVVANDIGPTAATTEGGTLIWEDEDVASDSDYSAQRQDASGANTVCSWTVSSAALWAAAGTAVSPAVLRSIDPAVLI